MRITKKLLRETKRGMNRRVNELCAALATGQLKQEWERCFSGIKCELGSDAEIMRSLISDMIDRSIPEFWIE